MARKDERKEEQASGRGPMYLFHLVAQCFDRFTLRHIVPDVRFVNAVISRASLREHSKSTLLKNDASSSYIDTVISNTLCYMPTTIPRDLAPPQRPDGVTVDESLAYW